MTSLSIFWIFSSCCLLVASKEITYTSISSCQGTVNNNAQFFNPSIMGCDTCSQSTSIQERSNNGMSCQCLPGYKLTTNYGGNKVYCEQCLPSTLITSADGWSCLACDSTRLDSAGKCAPCSSSQITVERDVIGSKYNISSCRLCLDGTTPSTDRTQCVPCSTKTSGGSCNISTSEVYVSSTDEMSPTQKVSSKYFGENLLTAGDQCGKDNATACQVLGNLCVLLFYSKTTAGTDACSKYSEIKKPKATVPNFPYWPVSMPWLFYGEEIAGVADATLDDTTLNYTLTSGKNISLIAAKFSLNGTFLGYVSVLNGLLQLCGAPLSTQNAAYSQGTNYKQKCTISVDNLFDKSMNPLVFYDLYLLKNSDTGVAKLVDIPLLIYNYKSLTVQNPNEQTSRTNWQLTRRLFLVDNVAAIQPGSSGPDFVRYASEISLIIRLLPNQQNGIIYPPYFTVRYSTVLRSQLGQAVPAQFSVTYTTDQTEFQRQLSISMGITSALAALWGIFRTWAWARRAGLVGGDIVLVIKFLLYGAAYISNMFLIVTFSICFYYLIFYKNQSTMAVVIPNSDQDSWVIIYIAVAAALKLIDVIHLIAVQCTVDIFFIDWERPKQQGPNSIFKQNVTAEAMVDENKDQTTSSRVALTGRGGDDEIALNRRGGKSTTGKRQVVPSSYEPEDSVSIWRTYFCCNEWNEIQTHRKTWPLVTVFSLLFFMKIVGFENVVSYDTNGVVTLYPSGYRSDDTRVFRIGLIVAIFIISGAVQWFFNLIIYEKFIDDKLRNYVDLCSVCNVSVFIMATRQYGYYIHGQSVHSTADVGLRVMYEQLQKEKDNLVPLRGLDKITDQQTFMMALPTTVRENLDRLYAPFIDGKNIPVQLKTYRLLNRFLSQFIYQGDTETMHYTITQRSLLEDILDCEMADSSREGHFYKDEGTSFGNVLFYGNELTLYTFEILVFCVFDIIWMNTVLDCIMLWIVMEIVTTIRGNLGLRNLTKKTLVDERFLI